MSWSSWTTGGNTTDNFARGRSDNLLGTLDPDTGTVLRVLKGLGSRQVEVAEHPATGRPLVGATLPDWQHLRTVSLAAASALPGLRIQHWDLAVTAKGPVILEVNALGDLSLRDLVMGEEAGGTGWSTNRSA